MAAPQDTTPDQAPSVTTWRDELADVGFIRRILISRRWYGPDWWFVAVSAVMVVGFITLAIIPQVFAPYPYDELVGPRFLAPGERPDLPVLVVPQGTTYNQLSDLAVPPGQDRPSVGVLLGEGSGLPVHAAKSIRCGCLLAVRGTT